MHEPPLILVVDDTPTDALLLSKVLARASFQVLIAHDGITAVDMAVERTPDLILLDMTMPGRDGLETCRVLKSQPITASIPVIFVTAHSDSDHVVHAFAAGGSDYVIKPIRVDEILARVSVQLRLREAEQNLVERNVQLESLSQQLAETNVELARQSRVDALTNLLNRRAWDEAARLEHERAQRHNHVFSVLMLDVDFFKAFNDSQGHQAGDDCLRGIAAGIASACRTTDLVGRYGGEEFIVLAPETLSAAAALLAERIRQTIWSSAIAHPASPAGRVTVSIGVAASDAGPLHEVLRRADGALYMAKKCGRNLVYSSDGVILPTLPKVRQKGAEASSDGGQISSSVPSVLIVEDNPSNRMVYRACLAKEAYRITEAENGQAALAAVAQDPPAVIIMDIMMPMMDGLECTKLLKADPQTRDIPIIFVSARNDAKDVLAGLDAGADEYLTKPIRTAELVVRVRSMVRWSRERQDLLRSYRLRAEQIRILSLLVNLCRAVGQAVTFDEVLGHALEAVAQVTACRRVSVMLPDADRKFLSVAKCKGLDHEVAAKVRVPIGTAIAGKVFESRHPIIVNTEEETARHGRSYESDFFVSVPMLSAPLGTSGEIIGVLNVTERVGGCPFEARELEYVDLVANIVGSAIQALRNREARDEARDLIVVSLAKLAEHRDDDTARHVDRVTQYSRILAETLQKQERFRDQVDGCFIHDLAQAVPLHDIGKVAIPDSILRKPGKLSVQEMAIMRTHADIGAETLRPIIEKVPDAKFLKMAEEVIRSHHEWYDGTGYPAGLCGEEIPLAARIVALADVYDALITDRVYKKAITHEEAEKIIVRSRGTQFDPSVVEAFLESKHELRRLAAELADCGKRPTPPPSQSVSPSATPERIALSCGLQAALPGCAG